jgi:hypothetical protein
MRQIPAPLAFFLPERWSKAQGELLRLMIEKTQQFDLESAVAQSLAREVNKIDRSLKSLREPFAWAFIRFFAVSKRHSV